jgi:hypothetical protein
LKNYNDTIGNQTSAMACTDVKRNFLPQNAEAVGVQVLRMEKFFTHIFTGDFNF